jgi:hypothetical protein
VTTEVGMRGIVLGGPDSPADPYERFATAFLPFSSKGDPDRRDNHARMRARRGLSEVGAVAAAALVAATAAGAATVTVNATVTAGSTLSVSSLNAPSLSLTLNGDDQTGTYQSQLQVIDSRGLATGGGWNLTIGASQFGDGAGHTLPASADTISTVTSACHSGSTCTLPTNSISNTNLAVPLSPSTAKFLNAATATGLGRIDVNVNVSVAVPANTIAATYSSTLTVAAATGP